jgi:hypothetical protein
MALRIHVQRELRGKPGVFVSEAAFLYFGDAVSFFKQSDADQPNAVRMLDVKEGTKWFAEDVVSLKDEEIDQISDTLLDG